MSHGGKKRGDFGIGCLILLAFTISALFRACGVSRIPVFPTTATYNQPSKSGEAHHAK